MNGLLTANIKAYLLTLQPFQRFFEEVEWCCNALPLYMEAAEYDMKRTYKGT